MLATAKNRLVMAFYYRMFKKQIKYLYSTVFVNCSVHHEGHIHLFVYTYFALPDSNELEIPVFKFFKLQLLDPFDGMKVITTAFSPIALPQNLHAKASERITT